MVGPSAGYANDDKKVEHCKRDETIPIMTHQARLHQRLACAPIPVVVNVDIDGILEIAAELLRLLLCEGISSDHWYGQLLGCPHSKYLGETWGSAHPQRPVRR